MVVASLVASVVFFNMATMPENYRQWYEQERQAYKNLEARCNELAAALGRKNQALTAERETLQSQLADVRAERDAASNKASELAVKLGQAQNNIGIITTKLTDVEKTLDAQRATNESLSEELQGAYERLNKAREDKALLADNLKEAEKRIDLLQKNLRLAQRQREDQKAELEHLNTKIRDLERRVPGAVAAAETEPIAPPGIAGTITAVEGNLASANVGSAHGVKDGMMLIVYRGDQFVGHLKVEEVEVNESAGMVVNKRLDPIQGDRITSSTSLNTVN
jgi:septal ring factor EnvC (AmiA/AmiB activator)